MKHRQATAAAAVLDLMPVSVPALHPSAKPARTRYVRLFPERMLYVLDRLTDREVVAYLRLCSEFVQLDGALPADDKRLAAAVKLKLAAWCELRDKLLMLGLGRIEHGFWIDDDQLRNLEAQRRGSEQSQRAAQARWRKAKAADEA